MADEFLQDTQPSSQSQCLVLRRGEKQKSYCKEGQHRGAGGVHHGAGGMPHGSGVVHQGTGIMPEIPEGFPLPPKCYLLYFTK